MGVRGQVAPQHQSQTFSARLRWCFLSIVYPPPGTLFKGIRYAAAQGLEKPSQKVPGNVCLKQHLRAVPPEENQDYVTGWHNQSCTPAKHAFCSNEGPVSQPVSQIYTS